MQLYEATNGWTGESYMRVYVWAENEHRALTAAIYAFQSNAPTAYKQRDAYWKDVQIKKLFDSSAGMFSTAPSDSGFDFGNGAVVT